jgi:probable O-glycosylation ligase (exosortase A-associated)
MPLRDLLVTAIVLGALPFVLKHAYIGVLLWTWISIMNPHRLAWGFAYNAPFAAIAAGVTLISLVTTTDKVRLPKHPAVYALMAFVLWMCITTALALDTSDSMTQLTKVLKIQLMTFVGLAVLHEKKHIRLFVWINVISIAYFGAKGGIYTFLTGGGGRVWGPGGFIGGNNEIGLAIIVAIPLMNFLRHTVEQVWLKHAILVVMFLSAAATLGTQSRGALLAIAAMAGLLWLRSPRKLPFGVLLVTAGIFLIGFMPGEWADRMRTIQTYEQDTSAMGRINAWGTMFNLANDRLPGGGFDVYSSYVFQRYAPDPSMPRAAHSIYFQVLGEHGWIGLILFLAVWVLVWRAANDLRRLASNEPEFAWVNLLAGMCQVALIGYAVGGAFLSLAYYDFPYNILIIVVCTQRWLAAELSKRHTKGKAGSAPASLIPAKPAGASP